MRYIKKFLLLILSLIITCNLSSCKKDIVLSETLPPSSFSSSPIISPDLSGQWKQIDSEFEGVYHGAVISGNIIEIYCVSTETGDYGLYWSGTFSPPDTFEEPYSWFSKNDSDKTLLSLFSSWDDTKAFTYENNQISYVAKLQGITCTVHLKKENWTPDLKAGEFYDPHTFPLSVAGIEFEVPTYFKKESEAENGTINYTAQMGTHTYAKLTFIGFKYDSDNFSRPSQEEFYEAKGQLVEELKFENSAVSEVKDILLAGQPGVFFVSSLFNQNNIKIHIYTCFSYNLDNDMFIIIYLTMPSDRDYSKYFNQLIESASLPNSSLPISGIRPEFKEAMDSYEAFFDEYVAFMQKFAEADDTLSLLSNYSDYMAQYAEAMEKLNAIGDEDMSTEESLYYMDVTNRISKKLIAAMQ